MWSSHVNGAFSMLCTQHQASASCPFHIHRHVLAACEGSQTLQFPVLVSQVFVEGHAQPAAPAAVQLLPSTQTLCRSEREACFMVTQNRAEQPAAAAAAPAIQGCKGAQQLHISCSASTEERHQEGTILKAPTSPTLQVPVFGSVPVHM